MSSAAQTLESGRAAAWRRAWREAYPLLKEAAEADASLAGDDLELLAEAAYWTGRLEEALELREQAYAAHVAADPERAASVALKIALDNIGKGALALANGWLARGERILDDLPESRAHGMLAVTRSQAALTAGRLDEVIEEAERAHDLGRRFGDRDSEAFGLVLKGVAFVIRGNYDEGLRLLDEASTAAVAGELTPFSSCAVYCMTITGCHSVGDVDRARQWTDAAHRWCQAEDAEGFPGACRVHRSEILHLTGDWEGAESEALGACRELGGYDVFTASAGYYQIGEIRRRRGDFAAAEEAYGKARALGREPEPGLALLRLAQGQVDEAVAAIRRALLEEVEGPFPRAQLLSAQVEIALAAGDAETAHATVAELDRAADTMRVDGERTPLMEGTLQLAHGQIELAADGWEAAATHLRKAVRVWSRIGAPYETARARMGIGLAYAGLGDRAGSRAELEAAKETFERLGAVLDAQRAMELLGESGATRRTFVFTDIVDSTRLLDELGDEAWRELLDRHDRILRAAISGAGGDVIKHTGDGFFAAFETPAKAVAAATRIHADLTDEDRVRVRIGLHSGEALVRGSDYTGRGVNVAARLGALAGPGEILASAESLADGDYEVTERRTAELRGFAEPVEVARLAPRVSET